MVLLLIVRSERWSNLNRPNLNKMLVWRAPTYPPIADPIPPPPKKKKKKKKKILPFWESLFSFFYFSLILLTNSSLKSLKAVPGRVAQSVTCLATDACLTADPGVASSIPARYHTFVEIDHETNKHSPPSADLFKKGCCQLQAKVCAQITG